jgi:hypothetical protein
MPSELMMTTEWFVEPTNCHPSKIRHFGWSSAPKREQHSLNGRFAPSQETLAQTEYQHDLGGVRYPSQCTSIHDWVPRCLELHR